MPEKVQFTPNKKEDAFATLIGHFGKWQFLVIVTVSLVKLSSAWVQMAIIFLTPNLVFWCKDFGDNSSRVGKNMTCYADCAEYGYDSAPFENTIITQWGLVCERTWMASFAQMVLQLGVLLGSVMFGFLSDRYGRKNAFLAAITSVIAVGFAVPFPSNYIAFAFLRFLLGVAASGTMVISFVIIMETVGIKYREICGCLFQIPFIMGHITIPIFAYYYRSWNTYSLAMAVPPLIYLGYFFVLSESPRWLVSVGKVEQASKIVSRAAEMNGLPAENVRETLKKMSEEIKEKSSAVKPNYSDLFKAGLLMKTVSSCTIWTIIGLTYFGFNQYISQTSKDPFITVATVGLIQAPAVFASVLLLKIFGRKTVCVTFFALGGLCVLALGVVPKIFWITLTLGCIGGSCVTIVCTSLHIYSSELFPTVVRNMGMGACSTSMRVGSMLAPFVSDLSKTVPWMPTVIVGLAPLFGALVCLLLPETKGLALPDSIEEVKNHDLERLNEAEL
ncbi:solute carrier family 22 member 12-like [Pararge aegeria]|uniref:Jg3773 protein n=1 Tax=Pararge aegeria aegeria TaxID=348720 RepID=A0A8S4SGI4_9NEOP|nr:solute carrier family 22 member 12-like [Pararge aegeria]CAH2268513.1 jg3773 [Pararge aegeria aegeria]